MLLPRLSGFCITASTGHSLHGGGNVGPALKCPTGSTLNVPVGDTLNNGQGHYVAGLLTQTPSSAHCPALPASPQDRAAPPGPQQPKPHHSPVLPLLPGEPRPLKVTPHRTRPTPRGEGTPAPRIPGKPSSDSSKSTPPLRGVATLGLPLPGFNSLLPPS